MPKSRKTENLGRNFDPIEVGDLVKCIDLGVPECHELGIVIEKIYYTEPGEKHTNHPDEYNCRVLFEEGERMFRARWLSPVSRKKSLRKE